MKNEKILKEWMEFARMDFLTAKHLYEHMYPKPLEIICYHCQQAIEKFLKGVLISKGVTIKKTHDLGLLAEMLQEYTEMDEKYLEMCDDLTPYKETRRQIAHGYTYYYDFKNDSEIKYLIILFDKSIRNMSLWWVGFSKQEIEEYPVL